MFYYLYIFNIIKNFFITKSVNKIYEKLQNELKNLKKITNCEVFGKSELGSDLLSFTLGNGDDNVVLVQGGIHAREYITSFLCVELVKYLSNFAINGKVVVVPLMNPDGLRICLCGGNFIKDKKKRKIIKNILKKSDKKFFKANANGVDLNVNFDCFWGQGIKNTKIMPSAENYIGKRPNSEREVKSLISLTKKVRPKVTLSFHSKGKVFYYGFFGQSKDTLKRQEEYIKIIEQENNYMPIFTKNSAGGYKDYCLMKLNIVGFTIEVGDERISHPIGLVHLKEIFRENKDIVLKLLKKGKEECKTL
ncbi:MAG: hypothetical protein EOM55_00600 [Clostridia bacterium]|nr:hypothetical protein [Clostridia bacterium]